MSWPVQAASNYLDTASAIRVERTGQNILAEASPATPHFDCVSSSAGRHLLLSLPLDFSPLFNRAPSTRRNVFLLRPPPVSADPRVAGPQAGAACLEGHGIAECIGCDFGSLRRHKGRNSVRRGRFSALQPGPACSSSTRKLGRAACDVPVFFTLGTGPSRHPTLAVRVYRYMLPLQQHPPSTGPARSFPRKERYYDVCRYFSRPLLNFVHLHLLKERPRPFPQCACSRGAEGVVPVHDVWGQLFLHHLHQKFVRPVEVSHIPARLQSTPWNRVGPEELRT